MKFNLSVLGRVVIFMFLVGCSNKITLQGDLTDFQPLEYVSAIEQIDDTTFFSASVYGLTFLSPDTMAFVDMKHGMLFEMAYQSNDCIRIGRQGKGPGEFMGLDAFVRISDSCYLMKDRLRKVFNVYRGYNFDYAIQDVEASYSTRMCYLDSAVYYYAKNDAGKLWKMDLRTGVIVPFGQAKDFQYKDITALRNQRHVVTDDTYIYAARVDRPVIEQYTSNGDLIQTLDLTYMPIFQPMIKQDAIASAGSWPNIGVDMYYAGGKLYYLVGYQIDEEHRGADKVIVVHVDPKLEVESLYSLSEGWYYSTLAVSDKDLYAFEWAQGIIHRYKHE